MSTTGERAGAHAGERADAFSAESRAEHRGRSAGANIEPDAGGAGGAADAAAAIASRDAELCDAIRGEPVESLRAKEAFAELYAAHYDAAMVSAYRLLGDRHRAEDAVAEAFAKTLRALRGGHGPVESFRGYLLTAVKSEALRVSPLDRRTDAVPVDEMPEAAELSVESPVSAISERDQLVRAFGALPEQWRQVLYLTEVEQLPVVQVAARIGASARATNSMAFRAREGLRSAYLQQYAEISPPQCASAAGLLARFVRGGLRKRGTAVVEAHLLTCERCRQQQVRLASINDRMRAWIGPAAAGLGLGTAAAVGGATSGGTAASAAMPVAVADPVGASGAVGQAATTAAREGGGAALRWIAAAAGTIVVAGSAFLLWPRAEQPVPVATDPPPAAPVVAPTAPVVEVVPEPEPPPAPEPAPEPEPLPEPTLEYVPPPPPPWESDESPNWVVVE